MLVIEEHQPKSSLFPLIDNAVGPVGKTIRQRRQESYQSALQRTIYRQWESRLLDMFSRLYAISDLAADWDSYGAPPPTRTAVENTRRVIEMLEPADLLRSSVLPSAEGGIGICFVRDDRYADLEFTNDGEVLGVRYVGQEAPVLIEMDGSDQSLRSALQQIRDHLG